jgi:predicted transcriptional regulator
LQHSLSSLSERKREAIFYNVILDWKQKDVAERMGITTVSVGQYVDQGCTQLARIYFPAEYEAKEAEELNRREIQSFETKQKERIMDHEAGSMLFAQIEEEV